MKKGNIVKMVNSCQLVKIIKIDGDILIVKKAIKNINTTKCNYADIYGQYQAIGKKFEININQVEIL